MFGTHQQLSCEGEKVAAKFCQKKASVVASTELRLSELIRGDAQGGAEDLEGRFADLHVRSLVVALCTCACCDVCITFNVYRVWLARC